MSITAKELDERFEKEDISDLLDFEATKSIKELKKPTYLLTSRSSSIKKPIK